MDEHRIKDFHDRGTANVSIKDLSPEELQQKLEFPKNEKDLQEGLAQLERQPVTFTAQLQKTYMQLKQVDMEIMENINIILASMPQTNITPHAQAALHTLRARREELFILIKFLREEINANKDASHAGVPIDSHYM